jgi:hypothetical protein
MGTAAEATFTLGGRPLLASQSTLYEFTRGGDELSFSATKLTPKFDLGQLLASKDARWVPVLAIKPDKSILVATSDKHFAPNADDIVIGH